VASPGRFLASPKFGICDITRRSGGAAMDISGTHNQLRRENHQLEIQSLRNRCKQLDTDLRSLQSEREAKANPDKSKKILNNIYMHFTL
jgi:hypothetical protein